MSSSRNVVDIIITQLNPLYRVDIIFYAVTGYTSIINWPKINSFHIHKSLREMTHMLRGSLKLKIIWTAYNLFCFTPRDRWQTSNRCPPNSFLSIRRFCGSLPAWNGSSCSRPFPRRNSNNGRDRTVSRLVSQSTVCRGTLPSSQFDSANPVN